jgi:hypothetical protein
MDYDPEAVDAATLGLMYLGLAHEGTAVWKGYPWEVTERLHEAGYIENPQTKNKLIALTAKGKAAIEVNYQRLFAARTMKLSMAM